MVGGNLKASSVSCKELLTIDKVIAALNLDSNGLAAKVSDAFHLSIQQHSL